MNNRECSQCGVSAKSPIWGFALLARDGWGLAKATYPSGAVERSWLCSECDALAERRARGLAKYSAPPGPREHSPERPQLKVLVVDDHDLMQRCLVRLLAGCKTVSATSGAEALLLLRSGVHFDVIVSDVMMPEMSGPELYARCYALSPQLARCFVFASGEPAAARRAIDEAVARVGAERAPPLLTKPTSRAALMAAVTATAASAAHASGTYVMQFSELEPADEKQGTRGSRY